jgi:hypothetical protein
LGNHEVKESDLYTGLWRVMGSRHLGGNEELKVRVVVNSHLVEVNEVLSTSLLDLPGDNGLQHGVERLSGVHKNDGISESKSSFEVSAHNLLLHRGFDNLKVRFFALRVSRHKPVIALHLRVNHERPSV